MDAPKKLFNRNYTLLFSGQSISRLGNQGFAIAVTFWLKHTYDSATLMGLIPMITGLVSVFLGPIGGTLADRTSRWRIIILSDLSRGLILLPLAGLIFFSPGATNLILIYLFVVSLLTAIIGNFFVPAIQATIPDLVPHERVNAANSLGQMSAQLSVFIGQGLGGTLYRLFGPGILFLIDGISFLVAGANETFVKIPQNIPEKLGSWGDQYRAFKADLIEGFRYIIRKPGLREVVFISIFITFFTSPVIFLLPFYVEDVLKARVDWYGFILVAYSVGTMIGYLFAGITHFAPRSRMAMVTMFIIGQGLGYGLLGLTANSYIALFLAFVGGLTGGVVIVNITTIMQVTTPGEIRGRVFGLSSSISASLAPIAIGLAGVITDLINKNIPAIYLACGAILTAISALMAFNRNYRDFLSVDYDQKRPARPAQPVTPAP